MNEYLKTILDCIITVAVPCLTAFIVQLIRATIANINSKTNNAAIKHSLDTVGSVITDAVAATSATVVDKLKKSGNFDSMEAQTAYNFTKSRVMQALPDSVLATLSDNCVNLDELLEAKIEAAVREQKTTWQ